MTLKGGRKAGQFNDLDEVSQAAGGQVTLTADIAAIGPTQRAPGMPIRDVSQTPPVTWVFVQGDVSPAAFNVIVPNVEPDTGVMPGRWKAGSPIGGDAWVQGGNSFGAPGVLGTNDAQPIRIETNNVVRGVVDASGNFGLGTTTPVSRLDVNGALHMNVVVIGDTASGPIGPAATTVDVASLFRIDQNTADQDLVLPNPTDVTMGRLAAVIAGSTAAFMMHGTQIQPASGGWFLWRAALGSWVPLKNLASGFAYATLSVDRAGIVAGSDVVFNQAVTTRGIALNVVTGVFSLTAGHTYEIEANILANVGAAGISDFQWVDAGTNAVLIATQAGARIVTPQLAADTAGQTCAKLIYTPAANQDIKLRCVAAVAATTIVAFGTYAAIKEIQ